MVSFSNGVKLPERIASLTMHVHEIRRMSAGMVVSVCWRTMGGPVSELGGVKGGLTD
jgi:hypothetical protein